MEPDSLLVRGLVDNSSGGLSPALDRSTTFEREPGGSSPYGRGHAPVTAEAEALLGALEDAEATVFASGMTAWTCICLTLLGEGSALALPTSGYYSLEGFASGFLERFGVELRRYDARDQPASSAPATAPRSRSSRRPPTRCSRSPTSGRPPWTRTPEARCCAATARSRRRSCSDRSTSVPTSPGRAPRSTSPDTPTCSPASSRRMTPRCTNASC